MLESSANEKRLSNQKLEYPVYSTPDFIASQTLVIARRQASFVAALKLPSSSEQWPTAKLNVKVFVLFRTHTYKAGVLCDHEFGEPRPQGLEVLERADHLRQHVHELPSLQRDVIVEQAPN
jgi:hypothetical protein